MAIQRIHIFGGAGSGKTTLAREIAEKLGLPHHELDDIYYTHVARRERRDKSERDRLLQATASDEAWVMEGLFWQPWVVPSLDRADKIVVLATPARVRRARIIKRHFKYLAKAKPALWPTFFPTLIELLRNNRRYDEGPLRETLDLLSDYDAKLLVCSSTEEAINILGLTDN